MSVKPFIKVPLVLLENLIFGMVPPLRPLIERHVFNPLDFKSDHIDYSERKFNEFSDRISIENVRDAHVLELGPGGSIGFGLLALESGAKHYTAIDDGLHTFIERNLLRRYFKLLKGNTHSLKSYFSLSPDKKATYRSEKITFATIDQKSCYPLTDGSIDIIYSCAVLEHVYNLDLCFGEMARVLKSGGVMYHEVDLRDHIFSQKSLFFLTLSDIWFKRLFSHTGTYVNRERVSRYRKLAEKYGLSIVFLKRKNELPSPKIPKGLHAQYSEEDISTLTFTGVFRKSQ